MSIALTSEAIVNFLMSPIIVGFGCKFLYNKIKDIENNINNFNNNKKDIEDFYEKKINSFEDRFEKRFDRFEDRFK